MLNDEELEAYFSQHKLSEPSREYIRLARAAPSRLVGTQAHTNVVTWFVSAKTGLTIQAESRTGEYAMALELEYDSDVIEFWDQPEPVSVVRTLSSGKPHPGSYTPEFVVLRHSGPEILEVKPEEIIQKLIKKYPTDWLQTTTGVTYRPAVEAYQALGMRYRVISIAELNPIRTANLKLLLQSRKVPNAITPKLKAAVVASLAQETWIRLSDLGAKTGVTDLTPLVQMVDLEILHASLSEELLAQPESTWIASSEALLTMRKQLGAPTGQDKVGLTNLSPVDCLKVPKEKQAIHTINAIERLKSGERGRTPTRWLKKIEAGAKAGLSTFRALLPQTHLCGNRTPRLHQICVKFLNEFIIDPVSQPTRLTIRGAYRLYKERARKTHPHLPPVTRKTFARYLLLEDQVKIARGRGGRRAANAAEAPTPVEKRQLLATRPWELGTMDHYEADIMCVLASGEKVYKARAWVSVLIDVFTGEVLAVSISFRAPSRKACAMVLRSCVRRHGRLPEEIIVDRGSDFQSVYFVAVLADRDVNLVLRPSEHPRYGSQAEIFFKLFKSWWLSMRPGNLANYREARAVSRSHAPCNTAELTIEQLLVELYEFADWHNSRIVGINETSALEKARIGLERFSCSGRVVVYDQSFIVGTAVDTGKYEIDPTRGIHIDHLHYWNAALTKVTAKGRIEVRKDPEDPYRVYALVGNEWVTCLASGARQFHSKDPVVRLAEAIRVLDGREARAAAKDDADRRLIERMDTLDEKWAAQRARGHEAVPILASNTKTQKDVFTQLRDAEVSPLILTDWE